MNNQLLMQPFKTGLGRVSRPKREQGRNPPGKALLRRSGGVSCWGRMFMQPRGGRVWKRMLSMNNQMLMHVLQGRLREAGRFRGVTICLLT